MKIAKTAALAPMADVADTAFRIMAKRFSAAYTVSEMVSAKGLVYGAEKTRELLNIHDEERISPCGIQIFGSEPDFMAKAAEIAMEYRPDIIDINAGCPVNKIVSGGSGSALMKTPKLFGEIVSAAVKKVDGIDGNVPITVKIRSGWDDDNINAVEIAKIAEQCGASAVTVHGRTRTQMYSGKSDLSVIADVKNAVSIPVIGNGDVNNAESCINMYKQTGCDLVMLGRAACGKPWIFREIDMAVNRNEKISGLSLSERLEVIKQHIELAVSLKGERVAMRECRKHTAWYIKGIRGAAALRNKCMSLETVDDFYRLIEKIKHEEVFNIKK